MGILLKTPRIWADAFSRVAPELTVYLWPFEGDKEDVDYTLVWEPPAGELATYPNLRIIFSLGAGVDHILEDPHLPDVPIVRMVEPSLEQGMIEYVTMAVLMVHRDMLDHAEAQAGHKWRFLPGKLASDRTVGVLGLGTLGGAVARVLAQLGFRVTGWSRSAKDLPGVESRTGEEGLDDVLRRSSILVNLLPDTHETRGLLDLDHLGRLPQGAFVVNSGRGPTMVGEDLLALLDAGHLAGAVLDVFEEEPLPEDSPFWSHLRVIVTPHIAAVTNPETSAAAVVDQIQRFEQGLELEHVVDPKRGY